MKLTSYTDFAMRSLQLAALKAPELVRVDDVVRVHGVACPHIMKIVHELGQAGYIVTQRGRGGGFRLANRSVLSARIAPLEEGIVAPVRSAK